jgi:hypothetical protein
LARATSAESGVLCLLQRAGDPALVPLSPEHGVAGLLATLEPGFDHFRDTLPEALRRLAAGGCWRLTLAADPAESFAMLLAGLRR